jgi:hypothetical protein|eukprot:COSAG01_NODE_14601_length_1433_cov_72.621439_2_plen_187_part_00
MEQLDSPRLVDPAPESAVLMEGELYKWRRSALKSKITRSNWQRRVFRIEVGSSALVYGKDLDSDSAKRLGFAHMEDLQKEYCGLGTQLQFAYALKDKIYCLRAETPELLDRWYAAIEAQMGRERRSHRRRAVRAITDGHLMDPGDRIPVVVSAISPSLNGHHAWWLVAGGNQHHHQRGGWWQMRGC